MDQRSLIELHSSVSGAGWDIYVDYTDKSRDAKVSRYRFRKFISPAQGVEVVLNYPAGNSRIEYEICIIQSGAVKYLASLDSEDAALKKSASLCLNYQDASIYEVRTTDEA